MPPGHLYEEFQKLVLLDAQVGGPAVPLRAGFGPECSGLQVVDFDPAGREVTQGPEDRVVVVEGTVGQQGSSKGRWRPVRSRQVS